MLLKENDQKSQYISNIQNEIDRLKENIKDESLKKSTLEHKSMEVQSNYDRLIEENKNIINSIRKENDGL
jgi:hypothetical protein